jgi:glycosyltransferase involved in cell wall biosynthesis
VSRGPDDSRLADLPDGDFLLYVGALGRHKGVDVLLRAYAGLDNPPPLVLIGSTWPDGPTTFPSNVHVLKDWPHEAIMQAWSRSLLALAPSVWPEPCATVVLEAMASGRAVISTSVGGTPDLIADGKNGLLVPPGDADALRRAIARLLSDPAERERLALAGRQTVAAFRAGAVVPRIEQAYEQLLWRPGVPVGQV